MPDQPATPRRPRPRTARQKAAARANGAQSRGPVTPQGKARSSQNGHLRSAPRREAIQRIQFLLDSDDQSAYIATFNDYARDFRPTCPYEVDLVRDIARCRWNVERAHVHYAAILNLRARSDFELHESHSPGLDDATHFALAIGAEAKQHTLAYLDIYIRRERRDEQRALHQLAHFRKHREKEPIPSPTTPYYLLDPAAAPPPQNLREANPPGTQPEKNQEESAPGNSAHNPPQDPATPLTPPAAPSYHEGSGIRRPAGRPHTAAPRTPDAAQPPRQTARQLEQPIRRTTI